MKLARTLVTVLAVALIGLCAGCASNVKPVPVSQVAAVVCSNLGTAHDQLVAINAALSINPATSALGAKATKDLAALQPAVNTLCAEAATITATQLNAAVAQLLPAFAAIVATLPIPPAQQAQVQGALALAEGAVGLDGVVESQIAAAKAASAPITPPLQ